MTTEGRDGFALVAALWGTVLLTTLALSLALEGRVDRLVELNRADEVRAIAAAEAGLAHGTSVLAQAAGLLQERAADVSLTAEAVRIARVATEDTVRLLDAWYTVSFQDPAARLSLSAASRDELARLLLALELDAREADRVAQQMADWRDADDARRPRGAERADYLAAGAAFLPANRDFDSVDEIRSVMGVTPELYARLEPLLTIAGSGRVALDVAPLEVLLALPGMTPEAAIVLLRMRREGRRLRDLSQLAGDLSSAARAQFLANYARLLDRVTFDPNEVVVRVEAGVVGGPLRVQGTATLVILDARVQMVEREIR